MIDVGGRIKAGFTIIGKNILSLLSTRFADANRLNSIDHPVSGRKQLGIFKDHFHTMFVDVHFCAIRHVMVEVKYVHKLIFAHS